MNEYGHIAADCPDRIPPSDTPAHTIRDITLIQGIILDLFLDIIQGIGTGITGPDPSHILMDIKVTVIITCTEVIPHHIIDALTEALYMSPSHKLSLLLL